MRNFKKLKIWQNAMDIATSVYKLTESFPESERFGLSSQIRRCAVSVSSNIAESASRISEKDKNRFMQIALGSLFELETQLLISTSLGFIDSQASDRILDSIVEEQKMISGFYETTNSRLNFKVHLQLAACGLKLNYVKPTYSLQLAA